MNNWNYSFSWTQPYATFNNAYQSHSTLQDELALLDKIDTWVSVMSSFPDAEEILKKVQCGSGTRDH